MGSKNFSSNFTSLATERFSSPCSAFQADAKGVRSTPTARPSSPPPYRCMLSLVSKFVSATCVEKVSMTSSLGR